MGRSMGNTAGAWSTSPLAPGMPSTVPDASQGQHTCVPKAAFGARGPVRPAAASPLLGRSLQPPAAASGPPAASPGITMLRTSSDLARSGSGLEAALLRRSTPSGSPEQGSPRQAVEQQRR